MTPSRIWNYTPLGQTSQWITHKLTLAPFVSQQWWRFRVSWLHPRRKQAPLVCFIPKILVKVGICDLLQWFNIIHRNKMAVQVHELNANLKIQPASSNSPTECKGNLTLLNKLSFKKVFYLTWHLDTWKLVGHISTVQHFSTHFSVKSTKTLLVFMHNFNIKISIIGCLTVSNYFSAPLPFHTKAVTSKKQVDTKQYTVVYYIM